jgi:hypothetical protein
MPPTALGVLRRILEKNSIDRERCDVVASIFSVGTVGDSE